MHFKLEASSWSWTKEPGTTERWEETRRRFPTGKSSRSERLYELGENPSWIIRTAGTCRSIVDENVHVDNHQRGDKKWLQHPNTLRTTGYGSGKSIVCLPIRLLPRLCLLRHSRRRCRLPGRITVARCRTNRFGEDCPSVLSHRSAAQNASDVAEETAVCSDTCFHSITTTDDCARRRLQ